MFRKVVEVAQDIADILALTLRENTYGWVVNRLI